MMTSGTIEVATATKRAWRSVNLGTTSRTMAASRGRKMAADSKDYLPMAVTATRTSRPAAAMT